jgi:hypothetical protein
MENEFLKRLQNLHEESTTQNIVLKAKTMIVPPHKRVWNGAIINVDPYMAIKKIKHKGNLRVGSDVRHKPAHSKHITKRIGDILSIISNPNVNRKVKGMLLKNIEVHTSPKVKHAAVKFKNGKLLMVLNSKYFRKK